MDMGGRRGRLSGTDFGDNTFPLVYSVRYIFCDRFPSMVVVLEVTARCQLVSTQLARDGLICIKRDLRSFPLTSL